MLTRLIFFALMIAGIVMGGVPHSHKGHSSERESDGAFSPRDKGHDENDHNSNAFDHEAILGSTREAEEFDQLPPHEAKKRLKILAGKMDGNGDGLVDKSELHAWILNSFRSLSKEESDERFEESDENSDSFVTWSEYRRAEFDIDDDDDEASDFGDADRAEELSMMTEDKIVFNAADADNDGKLSKDEFLSFTHPEEDAQMIRPILQLTVKEKDRNGDGRIDFQEYVGDRGKDQNREWLETEKERFDSDLDKNKDGQLDDAEIIAWIIPDNKEIATDEVNHLFAGSDEDVDGLLSVDEIVNHHDLFVGSEATDYGEHLHKISDEL